MHSLDELIAILKAFPLKSQNLNEKTVLNDCINLFGSLMLQRVRSLLADSFPDSDLKGLTGNSSLGEIVLLLNKSYESSSYKATYTEPSQANDSLKSSIQDQPILPFKASKNQVVSVGIDIESIHSFPGDILHPSGATFRSRTFSPREIAYALAKHSPIETLLGIFCAKEAVIKCFEGRNILAFRDIEITYAPSGRPVCNIHKHPEFDFKVSISHSSDYACAFALMTHSDS